MREYLRQLIRKALNIEAEKYGPKDSRIDFSLQQPPRPELGDYATNAALILAKQAGVESVKVADGIRSLLINIKDVFEEISIEGGGFLNFKISLQFLQKNFLKFDPQKIGRKLQDTILIEYSSPNIGKPLSIAHIRSTIIGDALSKIFKALGWKVITDNHLGDWGLQAGMLIAAYKIWGKKPIRQLSITELLDLYVKFNSEMKKNPELSEKAKVETLSLQKEDKKTIAIWKEIRKKSIKEFSRLYKILGIKFDYILGESEYKKEFPKIIKDAILSGIAKESQGAIVIPLEENEPPLIIQKQDGGYLYSTFDLAAIRYRIKRWKPKKMLYVVSNEQTQYFNQLFRACEKLGWLKPGQAVHVKFGLLRGEDLKRLSTRAGRVLLLEDVINEAVFRARKIVEEKNPLISEKDKENISRVVGIGALKYNDLSQNRNTDIVFSWEKMLDFEGNSAPYIQYTYARLKSILGKAKIKKYKYRKIALEILIEKEEVALMKKILRFQEALDDAARELAPNFLANYLWELASLTNTFYEKYPVLKAEENLKLARLFLITKTASVLKYGLHLLGIEAPERI